MDLICVWQLSTEQNVPNFTIAFQKMFTFRAFSSVLFGGILMNHQVMIILYDLMDAQAVGLFLTIAELVRSISHRRPFSKKVRIINFVVVV